MTTVFDELLQRFHTYLDSIHDGRAKEAAAVIDWAMPTRVLPPRALPCLGQLDRAKALAPEKEKPLVDLLADRRGAFHWGQTYTAADFGAHFVENYGWLEVFGTRGHFANDNVAAGVLSLGPGITYPDHHHIAEEIYIPLTGGTEWRMADEPFRTKAAGEVIHHASNVSHAMRTGGDPLLALYIWRGGPLAQKSTIVEGA